jgi:ABC-type Fe3+-hydroxamate transport system substrate-binding protein
MRVICLVPSLTETLLDSGVDVVGRTRFCIHPTSRVREIAIVGGTKDIDWEKVKALSADLLILDQEENPKSFADESPIPWFATHVRSVADLAGDLRLLSKACASKELLTWAERAQDILKKPKPRLQRVPGLIREIGGGLSPSEKVIYVIWKGPWMAAGSKTYIGSVLGLLGIPMKELPEGNYPVISENLLASSAGYFSSEPFPFAKKSAELVAEGFHGAIVDGEGYSWFGSRGIRFLEEIFSSHQ